MATATPRRALVAHLLTLPAFVFVTANVLKYELGHPWLHDALSPAVEPHGLWNMLLTAAVVGGPTVALTLGLWSVVRVRLRREPGTVTGTISVQLQPAMLGVVGVAGTLLAIIVGHIVAENAACIFGVASAC